MARTITAFVIQIAFRLPTVHIATVSERTSFIVKGILVPSMITCHVIQSFVALQWL